MPKPNATPEEIKALLQAAGAMHGDPQIIIDLMNAKQFAPAVIAKAIAATDQSHSCQITYKDAMERKQIIERCASEQAQD